MVQTKVNSKKAPSPEGGYSQAVLVEYSSRLLFISGQVPETMDGDTPDDFKSQCRLVWSNIGAQLEAAEMEISNLTKITIFLASREYAELNSEIRQEFMGNHKPALTVIITGIFNEKWLLEIDVIAAA